MFAELQYEYINVVKSNNYKRLARFPKFVENLTRLTNFLPDDATVSNRLWFLENETLIVPTCATCAAQLKWKGSKQYSQFCSASCFGKFKPVDDEPLELMTVSDLVEYRNLNLPGELNYLILSKVHPVFYKSLKHHTVHLPEDASTSRRMWHIDNGMDQPTCSVCDKNPAWDKDLRQYRTFCSSKCSNGDSDKKLKIKNVMLEKYGVDNISKLPESIEKRRATNVQKYGVDHYSKTDEFKEDIKSTCLERYGVDHPMKVPHIVDKITGVYKPHREFDMTELADMNHFQKMTFSEIAKSKNTTIGTLCRNFTRDGIQRMYYSHSGEEKEVSQFIQSLGFTVTENSRRIIPPKEIDIFIPEQNIAIEYCGLYWHSDLYKDKHYHSDKLAACNAVGVKLITIFQNEWRHKKDIVKRKLATKLSKNTEQTIHARKCSVSVIAHVATVKDFLNVHHIQGYAHAAVHITLTHDTKIVAIMSFKDLKDGNYDLVRFATSSRISGGFTKLLTHFERQYSPTSIKTFADLRWDDGNVYKNSGFVNDGIIRPDYSYINGDQLIHKFNYRHKSLAKMPGYDSTLSESQNCNNMGIRKIYDCGKIRFVKTFT